jgi:hypothetical protein
MIYLMTTNPPYKFARAPSKEICHQIFCSRCRTWLIFVRSDYKRRNEAHPSSATIENEDDDDEFRTLDSDQSAFGNKPVRSLYLVFQKRRVRFELPNSNRCRSVFTIDIPVPRGSVYIRRPWVSKFTRRRQLNSYK